MTIADIVQLMREGVIEILTLAAPVLIVALVVGLVVSIFQAITSIQEQTLTFVPKIFAILGVLALLAAWMFTSISDYTIRIFQMIPMVGK